MFDIDEEKKQKKIDNGNHPSIKNIKIRTKNGGVKIVKNVNRKKVIKIFCTECMGWENDPKKCKSIYCPLYSFRGKSLEAYSD